MWGLGPRATSCTSVKSFQLQLWDHLTRPGSVPIGLPVICTAASRARRPFCFPWTDGENIHPQGSATLSPPPRPHCSIQSSTSSSHTHPHVKPYISLKKSLFSGSSTTAPLPSTDIKHHTTEREWERERERERERETKLLLNFPWQSPLNMQAQIHTLIESTFLFQTN